MHSHLPGDRQAGGRKADQGVEGRGAGHVASLFVCLARSAAIQVQESLTGIAR